MNFEDCVSGFWKCYTNRFKTLWLYGEPSPEKDRLVKSMVEAVPDSFYYSFADGYDKIADLTGSDTAQEDWIVDAIVKLAENHSMIVLDRFGSAVWHFWQGKLWKVLDIQSRLFNKPVLIVLVSERRLEMRPLMCNMVFGDRYNTRLWIQPASSCDSDSPTCGRPLDIIFDSVVSGAFTRMYKEIDRNPLACENVLRLATTKDIEIKGRIFDLISEKYRKDEVHTKILDAIVNGRQLPEEAAAELPILKAFHLVERDGDGWRCVSPHTEFFFRFAYNCELGDTPANIEPALHVYLEDMCRRIFLADGRCDFNLTDKPYGVERLERFLDGEEGKATVYSAYGFSDEVEECLKSRGIGFETGKNIFGFDFIRIG